MLESLKKEAALTYTENGALTYRTSLNSCLDLFFFAGASRNSAEEFIARDVMRAYAEDSARTMKIIFYARDIRGGLGERRFFRAAVRYLAAEEPDAVRRNLHLFSEYGRWDDVLVLLGTSLEQDAMALLKEQFDADMELLEKDENVSLLGKWLPSVNTSSAETKAMAKKLAKAFGMRECDYRKALSALRKKIAIIENSMREKDYTFDYEKQPSRAMFKYRKAFIRNDEERYSRYLEDVEQGKKKLHADALYPYDIVHACLKNRAYAPGERITRNERLSLDAAWKSLPVYGCSDENCLAVVDGSGSMYWSGNSNVTPGDVAQSLGIYFAEHTKGGFANHFITFSENPKLVEVRGNDIYEKVKNASSYCECANTNISAVFDLLLRTAVKEHLPQSDMPAKLFIISDMEFDHCAEGGNDETIFEHFKKKYSEAGYKLPQIVFWNVNSRTDNVPVKYSDTGCALVSGMSPTLFELVTGCELDPFLIMDKAIMSKRYEAVR